VVKITVNDVIDSFPYNRELTNQILRRLCEKGWLQRLKRGIYTIVPLNSKTAEPIIEESWPLAMELFKPSFISGWSAAEHWDLTEQIFNKISVITTIPQRNIIQKYGGVSFRTRTVPKSKYFGTKKIWFGSKIVEVADPSRLILDILDFPKFGGGGRHALDTLTQYFNSEYCQPDLLLEYAKKYKRGAVFKRLGFLAEKLNYNITKQWLNECRDNISAGISELDPGGAKIGKIIQRWNIKVNMPL